MTHIMYYHENTGMQLPRENHSTTEISTYIQQRYIIYLNIKQCKKMDKAHFPEVNKVSRGIQFMVQHIQ